MLFGGSSAEREISVLSGTGVLEALRSRGVDAHAFDPAQRDLADLRRDGFARCFVALHGRHGEDGTVQGALELLGVPYTGSGVLASSLAMDKVMTKRIWQADGLPTPKYVRLAFDQQSREQIRAVPDVLGLPLIVKPPREGSSIGVTKVQGYSQMQDAVALSARYDADVLCEEFIEGEEVTCAVLGAGLDAVALPVVRIAAPEGAYDYQNKYFTDDVKYHCPSGLPEAEERAIQHITLAAYRTLGCRGWGRADLMIRASDRKPFLLEMNTSPGMTSHSLVPMSARAAGISYEELCLRVLASAALDSSGRKGHGSASHGVADSIAVPFDVRLMNLTANLVFVACALVLLAAGAWWVLRQPFFPLAAIRVDGQVTHNNEVTLRANVAPQLSGNFFTVDLAKARAAFESVPWVRKAVVRREFPNRLRATLTEQVLVAHWGDESSSKLVNNYGEVFEANVAEVDDNLPRLDGPDEQAGQVLGMYRVLAPIFQPYELQVDELELSARGSWQVVLNTGATIELGRGQSEEVSARLQMFLKSVTAVAQQYGRTISSVEAADLRHRDAYALRLRGVTTVGPDPKKK